MLGRRAFAHVLIGSALAASRRAARAQPRPEFTPTRRGGGGPLRLLWWQAPTLLNPHFASGVKDADGARVVQEPLLSVDPDGQLVPTLAAEVPSLANGL